MENLSGQPLLDNSLDRHLFVDRERELAETASALARRVNVLLIGERGSGKTSFLYRLQGDLRTRGLEVVYVAGYLLAESASDLLGLIRYRLGEPQTVTTSAFANAASLMTSYTTRVVPEGERVLQGIDALERGLGKREQPAVVLLDEMPNRDEARKLFARMRDEVWRLPLVWVVAITNEDAETFLKPPADAFFGRVIRLPGFSEEASRQILASRVPALDSQTVQTLVQRAGGNPRRLVSLAQDVAIRGANPAAVAEQAEKLLDRLNRLGDPAKRLYAELEVLGHASPSDRELLQRLGWKRSRAQQVLAKLEEAGLVVANQETQVRGGPKKIYRPSTSTAA